MKKLFFLTLTIGLLFSCGSGSSPEDVAKKFLIHISEANFTEAKKYCTEETKSLITMVESFASQMAPQESKLKIEKMNCAVEGDLANCTYCCNEEGGNEQINLKKVDGKWLVSISKDDLDK